MIPNWGMVREISSSKVIATTSIWVFIVPIIFKAIQIQISISDLIPITFSILYFSGVSFFLGAVIYNLFASQLVRKYDSYSSFSESGGGVYFLQTYLTSINHNDGKKLYTTLDQYVTSASANDIDGGNVSYIEFGDPVNTFSFKNENLKEVFWIIYVYFLNKGRIFILLSLFFHVLGFLGLCYLFINNFFLILFTQLQA